MNLVKTSLLNGIAVSIKLLTYFIINKVLAVLIGPTGFVALGQFQNAIQMITTFASGAINTGVTKYTAENYNDHNYQIRLWQTAGKIILCCSFLVGIVLAIFCKELSLIFFANTLYYYLFLWLAVTLIFFNLNILLLAILTGKKEIRTYVIANIAGSIFSLVIVGLMAYFWKLNGALIALTLYQSLSFLVTLSMSMRKTWFKISYLYGDVDKLILLSLSKFTLMALTSAIVVPLTQILIRDLVKKNFSLEVAGLWEGMNRLSSAYLMMATTTLSVYYLPRLSEIQNRDLLKKEIFNGLRFIVPFGLIALSTVFVFRDFIVKLFFAESFWLMRELFFWQLMGDLFKISSWLLGYVLLAKAYMKWFVFTEVFFSMSLYVFTAISSSTEDYSLITLGYSINYISLFIFLYILLSKKSIL